MSIQIGDLIANFIDFLIIALKFRCLVLQDIKQRINKTEGKQIFKIILYYFLKNLLNILDFNTKIFIL
jgi:hypothetical protein